MELYNSKYKYFFIFILALFAFVQRLIDTCKIDIERFVGKY